jgi:hypothetical protein
LHTLVELVVHIIYKIVEEFLSNFTKLLQLTSLGGEIDMKWEDVSKILILILFILVFFMLFDNYLLDIVPNAVDVFP